LPGGSEEKIKISVFLPELEPGASRIGNTTHLIGTLGDSVPNLQTVLGGAFNVAYNLKSFPWCLGVGEL
jgi:hypothetical protein